MDEVFCYYDPNLILLEDSLSSSNPDYNVSVEKAEIVQIDGNEYQKLIFRNICLPFDGSLTGRTIIYLSFETPEGYTNIFNNFYCEIGKVDDHYIDQDSTPGNALVDGTFDTKEDDAHAFLNKHNLSAFPYGLKYEIKNSSIEITDYIGNDNVNALYIPSEIDGIPVTNIGEYAFQDSTTLLNNIFIPSSVKYILTGAFNNSCDDETASMQKVIISEGVSWIGALAFYNCTNLEYINLPSTVSTICPTVINNNYYYGAFLSYGLYMYQEYPNPSIKDISIIEGSYAEDYLRDITYNEVATYSDLISHGKQIYTVHYDVSTNGGDWLATETRPASTGDAIDLTLNANKNGYKFIGWNTNPLATEGLSSLEMGDSDIVLYAIFEETVSSIVIQNPPTKTTYIVGENLDASGLSISAKMSDGTSQTITSGFTVSTPDMATPGEKTVTVTYAGKTTSFTIYVQEPAAVDPDAAHVYAESVTARPGETIQIPLYVENNPGVAYVKFKVAYDSDKLDLISAEDQGIFKGIFTTSQTIDVNPYVLQWMNAGNATGNGCFVMLTFKVLDGAAEGDVSIRVTYDEAYNETLDDVAFTFTNPTVTIRDYTPGDINDDGVVNGKDGIILSQYLAEWGTEINLDAADVNGDGVVNGKDSIILSQYLAAWDVELGK